MRWDFSEVEARERKARRKETKEFTTYRTANKVAKNERNHEIHYASVPLSLLDKPRSLNFILFLRSAAIFRPKNIPNLSMYFSNAEKFRLSSILIFFFNYEIIYAIKIH